MRKRSGASFSPRSPLRSRCSSVHVMPVCSYITAHHESGGRTMRQAFLMGFLLAGLLAGWTGAASAAEAPASVTVLVAYHSATGHTEKMAQGVVEGAARIPGTKVVLKRVGDVAAGDLFSADAVVVGSPVYWSNMSGDVKKFFDDWQFKFGVFPEFKMRNKVGAAFATGGQVSSGKEVTMLTILAAMLGNQMIVVSGGGAFGASATTEGDSPGIDDKELASAKELGARVAEVAWMVKRGRQQ
ncbi:MAG: flavodoxin family protein [Nitrospiraceae bacterium]|nr:flavodoxin family protein [Nitrospiraceae bacterium]